MLSAKEQTDKELYNMLVYGLEGEHYTKIGEDKIETAPLEGEVPSPINPPSGCPFHTRCASCMEICSRERPEYREVRPNHFVACHLYDQQEEDRK